jgi:hypothetical protein
VKVTDYFKAVGRSIMWKPPVTHDLTTVDYAFTPRDGGQRGHIACWSGKKPFPGEYLILRNGDRSSRYEVVDVDLCMNVDPPTMWMAELKFMPRMKVVA